jgi:hypothetical protein
MAGMRGAKETKETRRRLDSRNETQRDSPLRSAI